MNSELKQGFRRVTLAEEDYPASLRELADRPEVLFVKGRWPILDKELTIGIVGARRASPYGLEAAKHLTTDLVREGVVTVSGLASGIDACAHRATLQERGWTIAVLGHGFGHMFPKENASLFREIENQGTLLTEFPYDTAPQPRYFPQRNRIISGLSQGVLVVEAGEHSGALITARCAAEQGRDVFVVPGGIFSPLSRGCHRLIKEGAKLTESANDVLEEYGTFNSSFPADLSLSSSPAGAGRGSMDSPPTTAGNDGLGAPGDDIQGLNANELKMIELLSAAPLSVDEMAELSGMPVERLAQVLLSLELKGRIMAVPGQRYVTRH